MLYYFVVYFSNYETGEFKRVCGDKVNTEQEAENQAKTLILEKYWDSEWALFDWVTFAG
jgi:hypothetical protein